MRRRIVFGLNWEKSCPVWARRRTCIFFSAFSAVDAGGVGGRGHLHPIHDLGHLHVRVAPDEVGEDAFVIRGQVLHQHKGHAGIDVDGHIGEESFEGRQSAGRRADADDGEPV